MLTTSANTYKFTATELIDLKKMLQEIDSHTIITPITSINDLLLNPETGKTNNNYSYSNPAFVQLCGLLSASLSSVVVDISGKHRKIGEEKAVYSQDLAVEIFNKILKLRYNSRLQLLQIVRNTKTKSIDGLVGLRYRYLSNIDFLSRVSSSFNENVKFLAAYLYGRQLALRYINETAPEYKIGNEQYKYGLHFANAEMGGYSVRAGVLLVRLFNNDCALNMLSGQKSRVIHAGREFEQKIYALFDRVLKSIPPINIINIASSQLYSQSLNFTDNNILKRQAYLERALKRKGLSLNLSKRIVNTAMRVGGDQTVSYDLLPEERIDKLKTRTMYDLFVAIIHEAASLSILQREQLETTAYNLLLGKFTL